VPGTSGGTGQPYYLRCAKCKLHSDWRSHRQINLEATGRWKPRMGGRGGSRISDRFFEYRCLDCKHVGWSKHKDAERLFRKKESEGVKTDVPQ
jgi:hypothetical protein